MFNTMKWSIFGIVILLLMSCSQDQEISTLSISYLFNESEAGWTGDFADYPEGDSIAYGLLFKHDTIQDISTSKGLRLSGNNGSDDLFMFVKKKKWWAPEKVFWFARLLPNRLW